MSRRAALVAAVALAACNQSASSPSLHLNQATGIALFYGYTERHPAEAHPYMAIANNGSDELVLADAVDDAAVSSSIAIRPLSVPIPDPRPALVAAARLGDDTLIEGATANTATLTRRPDLLVAVSSSATTLQLVKTWLSSGAPEPEVDVPAHAVDLGRPVQALVAVPAVDSSGSIIAGQALVVAALVPGSGQGTDLAVVTYARATTGTDPDAIVPVSLTPVIQHLDFEVRSFGVDPSVSFDRIRSPGNGIPTLLSPRYLYAASGDPIPDAGGVLGVAELDLAGGPGAFAVRGLDARAPTTLVTGLTLPERNVDQTGSYDQANNPPADSLAFCGAGDDYASDDRERCPRAGFHPDGALYPNDPAAANPVPVRRVYAILDPNHCGRDQAIACGLAVLAPDVAPSPTFGHLLPNPFLGASSDRVDPGGKWSRQHDDAAEPYLPPIPIPGLALALVPVPPPAWAPYGDRTYQQAPFVFLAPNTAGRIGTAALAILSYTGRVFMADPSRWELLNDADLVRTGSAVSVTAFYPGSSALPQIGFYGYQSTSSSFVLWIDKVGAQAALKRDPAGGADFVNALTPGYTPNETFTVTYQGYLPGLDVARPAEVEDGPAAEQLRVALQARTPDGTPIEVYRVYDPSHGIRVGDIVELWTHGELPAGSPAGTPPQCPRTQDSTDVAPIGPLEGQVLSVDPPDAAHPGGSLVLGPPQPVVQLVGGKTTPDPTAFNYWTGADGHHCRDTLAGLAASAPYALPARIRARGADPADPDPTGTKHHEFLVTGAALGYLGRAVQNTDDDANASNGGTPTDYVLRTRDESTLPCPLIPWPFDDRTGQPAVACDDACRQTCESLTLVRKARRLFTVSVRCSPDDTTCNTGFPDFYVQDPASDVPHVDFDRVVQPTGPVVTFRLGVDFTLKLDPDGNTKLLTRDTAVRFLTQSGYVASSRAGSLYAGGTGVQATAGAAFDRTMAQGWNKAKDGVRVFVPYLSGSLIDVTPTLTNGDTRQMR